MPLSLVDSCSLQINTIRDIDLNERIGAGAAPSDRLRLRRVYTHTGALAHPRSHKALFSAGNWLWKTRCVHRTARGFCISSVVAAKQVFKPLIWFRSGTAWTQLTKYVNVRNHAQYHLVSPSLAKTAGFVLNSNTTEQVRSSSQRMFASKMRVCPRAPWCPHAESFD